MALIFYKYWLIILACDIHTALESEVELLHRGCMPLQNHLSFSLQSWWTFWIEIIITLSLYTIRHLYEIMSYLGNVLLSYDQKCGL